MISLGLYHKKPAITLNSPNGGEILDGCTSQNITWSINNNAIEGPPSGSYDIYVSFDNMSSWINLTWSSRIYILVLG